VKEWKGGREGAGDGKGIGEEVREEEGRKVKGGGVSLYKFSLK